VTVSSVQTNSLYLKSSLISVISKYIASIEKELQPSQTPHRCMHKFTIKSQVNF